MNFYPESKFEAESSFQLFFHSMWILRKQADMTPTFMIKFVKTLSN